MKGHRGVGWAETAGSVRFPGKWHVNPWGEVAAPRRSTLAEMPSFGNIRAQQLQSLVAVVLLRPPKLTAVEGPGGQGPEPRSHAVLLLAWVRWGPGAFSIWATSCLQSTGSTATCPVRASRHDETYRGAGPQDWLLLTPGASGSSVASAGCSLTCRGFLSGAPHGPVTSVFRVTRTDLEHLSGDGYSVTPAAPGDTPGSPWRNDVVSLDTYERVKRVLLATLPSLFFFR